MTDDVLAQIAAALRQDEGVRASAYQDSEGYWTIGCGRLIDGRLGGGLSTDEIDLLLQHDIARAVKYAHVYPWFAVLDVTRQRAVVEMIFNLGPARFSAFHRALAAMARGVYGEAADHFADSKWARQVGSRAVRLCAMIRDGVDPRT